MLAEIVFGLAIVLVVDGMVGGTVMPVGSGFLYIRAFVIAPELRAGSEPVALADSW